MTDLHKILLTSGLTILGGVLIFVVGQLLSRLVIEPVQELRKVIGEVRFNFAFFAPTIRTPVSRTKERSDRAYDAIMKCSCDLLVRSEAIPFYGLLSFFSCGFIPPKADVADAAKWLRGLTTYLHETGEKADSHITELINCMERVEGKLRIARLAGS